MLLAFAVLLLVPGGQALSSPLFWVPSFLVGLPGGLGQSGPLSWAPTLLPLSDNCFCQLAGQIDDCSCQAWYQVQTLFDAPPPGYARLSLS